MPGMAAISGMATLEELNIGYTGGSATQEWRH